MDYIIDNNILIAIKLLKSNGYEAYIVGGAIRDLILDLPINDYDIASNITLEKAIELFSNYKIQLYSNKRTLGVRINHTFFELSSFKGLTIEDDLLDRDFSINSIAYDIDKGIIDPYNGLYDLSKRIIRTINEPDIVFKKDPLRILRAIRFSIEKNFTIDLKTYKSMFLNKELLNNVKKERIQREFDSILLSDTPSKYLLEYKDILEVLISKIKNINSFIVIDNIRNNIDYRLLSFCYLLNDIDYTLELLSVFCYNQALINKIIHVLSFINYNLEENNESILLFLSLFGLSDIEYYFALKRAIALANGEEIYIIDNIANIARYLMLEGKIVELRNLRIKRKDLVQLGYDEMVIDKVLNIMLEKVIKKELPNDRKILFEYACKLKYDI